LQLADNLVKQHDVNKAYPSLAVLQRAAVEVKGNSADGVFCYAFVCLFVFFFVA
jgi:hypothetical protein